LSAASCADLKILMMSFLVRQSVEHALYGGLRRWRGVRSRLALFVWAVRRLAPTLGSGDPGTVFAAHLDHRSGQPLDLGTVSDVPRVTLWAAIRVPWRASLGHAIARDSLGVTFRVRPLGAAFMLGKFVGIHD
jgi:hypothetical protein